MPEIKKKFRDIHISLAVPGRIYRTSVLLADGRVADGSPYRILVNAGLGEAADQRFQLGCQSDAWMVERASVTILTARANT
jgi:hypothetical protein